jgi:hypothetical protein
LFKGAFAASDAGTDGRVQSDPRNVRRRFVFEEPRPVDVPQTNSITSGRTGRRPGKLSNSWNFIAFISRLILLVSLFTADIMIHFQGDIVYIYFCNLYILFKVA